MEAHPVEGHTRAIKEAAEAPYHLTRFEEVESVVQMDGARVDVENEDSREVRVGQEIGPRGDADLDPLVDPSIEVLLFCDVTDPGYARSHLPVSAGAVIRRTWIQSKERRKAESMEGVARHNSFNQSSIVC